jgi:hypothetical protein
MTHPERELVDAMAALVLAANSKFDARLHGKRKLFPEEELLELWQALQQYCGLMKGLDWIHRDVAREISGFREYLQLQEFGTPGEALALADRMECLLFSDYDAYSGEGESPEFDDGSLDDGEAFGVYEGICAGCDGISLVGDLGLCEKCGAKLERDLLRSRDWVHSVTAFRLTDEQRELTRRQVVKEYGRDFELIAVAKDGRFHGKGRQRK